jgi:hypothetical protein
MASFESAGVSEKSAADADAEAQAAVENAAP